MESFLYYLLRTSIIMALFYGFYKLFFGKNTFHNANRFLLLSILLLSAILPLFHFNLLPSIAEPSAVAPISDLAYIPNTGDITDQQLVFAIPWIQILIFIYLTGFVFSFFRYLTGLNQIRKIVCSSEWQSMSDGITLCVTNCEVSPFSWLSYIVISRKDYSADMNGAIIHHEKAHIQKNHSSDMILSDFFTCLFWFNPFSWLLRCEIQSVHEYQADEEVLKNGIDTKQYQLLLIRKSVGEYKFALANNFRQRDLHKRITMMIKTKTNKKMKWAYTAAFPVLLMAMIALSIPELKAQIIEQDPNEPVTVIGYGSKDSLNKADETSIQTTGTVEGQPLYIWDDVKLLPEEVKRINPDDIESVNVLKSETAIEIYGDEGKNGVIIMTSKNAPPKFLENNPLIIVDDEIMPLDFDINSIDPSEIKSIEVLKSGSVMETYGEKGKNGVVIINKK